MKTVLIVDANDDDRKTAMALLAVRYEVRSCATVGEAIELAKESKPDILVIDVASSSVDGHYDPLGAAARIDPKAGIICTASMDTAIDYARRRGASGYVEKPYRAEPLFAAVRLASAESASDPEGPWSPKTGRCGQAGSARGRGLIGDCEALREVARRIALYAAHDAPVLILGESGTGKELAAAAIHQASRRSASRFLPVDCAAIPETLAESHLFGTVKGAFTDAHDSKGVFESACGGTVFLDEIGELSLTVQAKFLRTVETGTGARVGSVDPVSYDVRILSATNAPLFGDGARFRPELVHRIDTLVLRMPALRDHKEDIPILAESFIEEFSPGKRISRGAMSKLASWDWPGNVRELRNAVCRATVMSGRNHEIKPVDIEFDGAEAPWQASLF